MVTTLRVVRLDASALVWATGTLDGKIVPELRHLLEELLIDKPSSVVLDLALVEAVDEDAIALLAEAAVQMTRRTALLALRLPGGYGQVVPDSAALRRLLAAAYPLAGQSDAD